MRLAPSGIAGRSLVLAAAAAGLAAAAAVWLHVHEERAERRVLEGRAATLAEALERSITEAMEQHDRPRIGAVVDALAHTEGVAGLAVAARSGEVAHAAGEAPAAGGAGAGFRWTEARLVYAKLVANGESCRACHGAGETNGAVLVALDATALAPRLAASARRKTSFAVLAFAALVTVALLVRRIQDRNAALGRALAEANAARGARAADLERLQAILDSMVDGVLFIDADDRIAMVNSAGRKLRNLVGGPGRPLRDCHPKASHGMLDRVMGYLRSGDDTGPAHSIIKEREGRLETTYAPVKSAAGAYLGTVMVIRDIAERRTLERRLLDAERLSGLGQMSAQIAHELRNPLNAIDGAAQYLRRRLAGDAEVAEYAGLIGEEVQRVNRFVAALLQVARPAEPQFAAVSVNRLLEEAARRAALARGLPEGAVALDLAPDLPVLDVDAPMIAEALVNLLQNAFDAGGTAPVELASRFEGAGGEGTIAIEVRDRGCGIPADQLDEVLRPFVTTKPTGTGLGLVVVTRAAEQHRARFQLARREGGGTVATLRFPVRRTAAGPAAERGAA
ncbi:MAG TPA: ATP-binding protein [Anaeromyxobacter sp.]|nr:ATP-binding protein [Anaeromyxobacter sp.]